MVNSTQKQNDQFMLLQTLTRESAAMRQRLISYFQFYMSVQIAIGGLLGLIVVSIPEYPEKLIEWAAIYIGGTGIAIGIGGFAFGAIWLSPKKRNEDWIVRGLEQIGNTYDLVAWNKAFRDHLDNIESANHSLRRHLNQIRNFVLIEVIFLIVSYILAIIITN
ncbi:MAG: hypothetical protein KJO91_05420 [Gammaproteobacteria bacterium]|nr:hypothetical protein [Gammaproteobacteria bacterium]